MKPCTIKIALPWLLKSIGSNYIFTQDGAPSHTSNLTQQWCKDNFSHFVNKNEWPPSSPDINPMDFSIWSILESKVSSKNCQDTASLNNALIACWKDLSEEVVRRSTTTVPAKSTEELFSLTQLLYDTISHSNNTVYSFPQLLNHKFLMQ